MRRGWSWRKPRPPGWHWNRQSSSERNGRPCYRTGDAEKVRLIGSTKHGLIWEKAEAERVESEGLLVDLRHAEALAEEQVGGGPAGY